MNDVCISHYRLLWLLSYLELTSGGDEKKILMNFECAKEGIYMKCTTRNLNLTESDKNSTFLMGETPSPPNDIVIEASKMFFIPPDIFKKFNDVREFIAKNNSIEEIYFETFADAHKLHYLILSYNKIKFLVDHGFNNASTLQTLKLQHNEIEEIGAQAFSGLTELRALLLSFNKIVYLPLFVFRGLESLQELYLDNNFITVISLYQFEKNLELEKLNFEHNQIATIDNGTFENLSKLERVELRENFCVNKSFAKWHADNQSELDCCLKCEDGEKCLREKCLEEKVKTVDHEHFFSTHVPLILLLFVSIFINFLIVAYCLIYKRRTNIFEPENFELITDHNGSAYQVY